MKANLAIALFLLFAAKLASQLPASFAPIGTRWEYNFQVYLDRYGSTTVRSIGDTVINNTTYRQLQTVEFYRFWGGDTVNKKRQFLNF